MKYKYIAVCTVMTFALFASCSQDIEVFETPDAESNNNTITFTTEMEMIGANTRTVLSPDNMIRWEDGDQVIMITDRASISMNGAVNPNSGQYEFSTSYYNYARSVVGYPINKVFSDYEGHNRIVLEYPTYQTAAKNTFDRNAGIMLANATQGNVLHFYNQFALLKFSPGIDCRQVIVSGIESGKSYGHMTSSSIGVESFEYDKYGNYDYVVLSGDMKAGETYYIAVAPQKSENGIKLTLTTRDNRVYTKEGTSAVYLPRNTILNLGELHAADMEDITPDFNGHEAVDLGMVTDGGKKVYYATKNLGAETPMDHGDYYAWGETELRYNSINEDGTINYKEGKDRFERLDYLKYDYYRLINKYSKRYDTDYYTMQPEDDAAHVIMGGNWQIPNPVYFDDIDEISCTSAIYKIPDMGDDYQYQYHRISGRAGFEDQTMVIPYITGSIQNNKWYPNTFMLMSDMITNVNPYYYNYKMYYCNNMYSRFYGISSPTYINNIFRIGNELGYAIRPVWVE